MKKILIFRTDRLGDYLIHSRPIFEIKKKYKDSFITVVCSSINKKMLKQADYIDELLEYNSENPFFSKLKLFFYLIKFKYYSIFILDGKFFSYLCNCFLRSQVKNGLVYKYKKKIIIPLTFYKPSKLYSYFFFDKIEYFTRRRLSAGNHEYLPHRTQRCGL